MPHHAAWWALVRLAQVPASLHTGQTRARQWDSRWPRDSGEAGETAGGLQAHVGAGTGRGSQESGLWHLILASQPPEHSRCQQTEELKPANQPKAKVVVITWAGIQPQNDQGPLRGGGARSEA